MEYTTQEKLDNAIGQEKEKEQKKVIISNDAFAIIDVIDKAMDKLRCQFL